MTRRFFFKKGQALIELLVAFGISSLILTSATTLFIDVQTANLVSAQYTNAQNLLEEAVTSLEAIRRRSFSELNNASSVSHPERINGRYELRDGTGTSSIYTISIEKQEVRRDTVTGQIVETGGVVDPNLIAFQITISWTTPRPRQLQRKVYFLSRDLDNKVWTQTTQADFKAGTLTNTTADESPGDVLLYISSAIFIERFHTETYKDQTATTAVWDIEAHQLRLPTTAHNWIQQLSDGPDLNDIFFTDNETGFAVGKPQASQATIFVTSNGGDLWTLRPTSVTGAELAGVYFTSQTTGVAVGKSGTIIRTTDGGVSWSIIPSPRQENLEGVWFVDNLVGVAVGSGGTVIRTTDGGLSWSSVSIGTTDQLNAIYFVNSLVGYVVGNNGLIYKTEDAGVTWISKVVYAKDRHLNAVFFPDELNGYAAGNNGIILHSSDSGETWQAQNSRTTKHLFAIWFVGNDGWAAGDNGTIVSTTNGGINWGVEDLGTNKNLRGLHFESYDVGWVSGFNGEIRKFQPNYQSPATGQSLKINSSLAEITKATLTSDMVVPTGTSVKFYLSANGGTNWEEVTPDVLHTFISPGNDLRWRAVLSTTVPTKTPVVYKVQIDVGGGYNPTGIFESQTFDGGKTVGFNRIDWDATLPEGTDITFQVAVSDNPDGPFNFVGPDGTATSFYNSTSSRAFWYTVAAARYLRFKAYFSTEDSAITPRLHEVRINYSP